ncbi:MAG: ABC transporter permease [Oscillospiraceae bacterium]|nr:ABC transporter permease [Oscillospiraceae bacterium]
MKFGNLLKKELRELLTKQAIISMVFTMVLLIVMGQVIGGAMQDADNSAEDAANNIALCNQDDSEFTKNMLENMENTNVALVELESDDYAAELERLDRKSLIIIPQGFGDSIVNQRKVGEVKFVNTLKGGGFSSTMSTATAAEAVSSIEKACSDEFMRNDYGVTDAEIELAKNPVSTTEYTVHKGRTAAASSAGISAVLMLQSMIAPFAIFFLLLMAAQMIMTAISTEKIDKTLETLLSAPVPRMTVLMAKMTAAVITALLNALFMMIGFVFYMLGMAGSAAGEMADAVTGGPMVSEAAGAVTSTAQAMAELGLALSPADYILFAIQLFLTLAIGLAISLILGAMATDVKSVQTLTMPIMIAVMIPFFVSMFMDVNDMSPVFRTIIYAIPFTHTYTALTNLMNGDMIIFWGGLAYQIVFFAVCMFLAVKMFTTDKLFTMSFSAESMNKKRKGKNTAAQE